MSSGRGDVRSRLGRLRGESLPGCGTVEMPFRERVERLLRLPRAAGSGLSSHDDEVVARQLGGEVVDPGLIRLGWRAPMSGAHGRVRLRRLQDSAGMTPLVDLPQDPGRLLFLDTETTGLAGGTGTVAFLVGLAFLEGDSLAVEQWLLTRFAGEPALLGAVVLRLGAAAHLVSFNGKSFDMPLLSGRLRLAGMEEPVAGLPHLDLLHSARRAFASRWSDCRLQTMERQLLGFQRRGDLLGAEVPAVWRDFLRRGDLGRLPAVVQHNRWDLMSLAALLPALLEVYAEGHPQADPLALARAHLRRGGIAAARNHLERQRDRLESDGLLELARLRSRSGDWAAALDLWESLAARGNAVACERLAKYHEHMAHDIQLALDWARRLLALDPENAAHRRRSRRLAAKLG